MNRQGVWWETRKINTVLAPPEKLLLDDHCRFAFPASTLLPYPSVLNLGCLLINTVPTKCSPQQLRPSALLVPLPVLPFPRSSRGSLLTTQYLHSSAASSGRPSLITPGSPASCQLYLIHGHWSNSLEPNGLLLARLPCPSPSPRVCSNSCPLSQWCHPTISSSVRPPSPPALNLSHHQNLF